MTPKALLILLVLLVLLLPVLSTDHSSAQRAPATATRVAEVTPEVTAAPEGDATAEATEAATLEPTAEVTAEMTPEQTVMLIGDPVRGDAIFHTGLYNAPACINCHSTTNSGKQGFALGPGLRGISEAAGTRVEGMTAAQYLEHSIRYPNDYIVSGFRGIMYPSFGVDYSDQEVADLVAYILTL